MKITKETLKQIIKEELDKVMKEEELDEGLFDFMKGGKKDEPEQPADDSADDDLQGFTDWEKLPIPNRDTDPGAFDQLKVGRVLLNNVLRFQQNIKGTENRQKWILAAAAKGIISGRVIGFMYDRYSSSGAINDWWTFKRNNSAKWHGWNDPMINRFPLGKCFDLAVEEMQKARQSTK